MAMVLVLNSMSTQRRRIYMASRGSTIITASELHLDGKILDFEVVL